MPKDATVILPELAGHFFARTRLIEATERPISSWGLLLSLRRDAINESRVIMKNPLLYRQLYLCAVLATSMVFGGCGTLHKRVEPATMFEDPSPTTKGLPDSLLNYDWCTKEPAQAETSIRTAFRGVSKLPEKYRRFATAAYCAYVNDLSAYQGAKLLEPRQKEKVAASGQMPKASSTQKEQDSVRLDSSALSPPATLTRPHYHWLHAYMESGLDLARSNCDEFFNHRERDRVHTDFFLNTLGSIITAVTALRTYGGDHARSAFNLAALQAGADSVGNDYKSAYLFSPELGRLYEKLEFEVLGKFRDAMRQDFVDEKYVSFAQLTQDLQRYESLCSRKSISRLLSQSIELVNFQVIGVSISLQDRVRINEIVSSLGPIEKNKPKTNDEWISVLPMLLELVERDVATRKKVIASGVNQATPASAVFELAKALNLQTLDGEELAQLRSKLIALAYVLSADDDAKRALASKRIESLAKSSGAAASSTQAQEENVNKKQSVDVLRKGQTFINTASVRAMPIPKE
jgi:hypothetical protein